jgi:hypothetical protein
MTISIIEIFNLVIYDMHKYLYRLYLTNSSDELEIILWETF